MKNQITTEDRQWLKERDLENFLAYAKIDTTSDPNSETRPTSPGQLELAELLKKQLLAQRDPCLIQMPTKICRMGSSLPQLLYCTS